MFLLKKYGFKKTLFIMTLFITILTSVISLKVLYYFQGYIDGVGIFLFLAFPLVVSPTFIYKFNNLLEKYKSVELELIQRNTELEKILSEVKELKLMIPICKSCKKVKDDKGYWRQLESYVSKKSDIDFTHSLCNVCVQKLYPELGL